MERCGQPRRRARTRSCATSGCAPGGMLRRRPAAAHRWSSASTTAIAAIAPLMRESVIMYGVPVALHPVDPQRSHAAHRLHRRRQHPEESYRAIWNALRDSRERVGCPAAQSARERTRRPARAFLQLAAADGCSTGRLAKQRLAVPDVDRHLGRLSRTALREVPLEPAQPAVAPDQDRRGVARDSHRPRRDPRGVCRRAGGSRLRGGSRRAGTAITSDPAVHASTRR